MNNLRASGVGGQDTSLVIAPRLRGAPGAPVPMTPAPASTATHQLPLILQPRVKQSHRYQAQPNENVLDANKKASTSGTGAPDASKFLLPRVMPRVGRNQPTLPQTLPPTIRLPRKLVRGSGNAQGKGQFPYRAL